MSIESKSQEQDRNKDVVALAETDYLFKRWNVAASRRGFVWIRPVAELVSPEELAGFLVMFRRCCKGSFPAAVVFEFNRVRVLGEQWTLLCELLSDFASQLGARCQFTSTHGQPISAAVLTRAEKPRPDAAVPSVNSR